MEGKSNAIDGFISETINFETKGNQQQTKTYPKFIKMSPPTPIPIESARLKIESRKASLIVLLSEVEISAR